jgi:H+/Cl- antiporter ClcA
MQSESANDQKREARPRSAQLAGDAAIYLKCILVGILSGAVAVAYRLAIGLLEGWREASLDTIASSAPRLAGWFAAAIAAGLATAAMAKRLPLIKGSGIPQVKALLMEKLRFDWARELPAKFAGGTLALGAGMSLGREGPSIQLGALVGSAVDKTLGSVGDHGRYLVTAGAAAGISAAFNAPLAGVLFCIEELHRQFSPTMLTATLIASFCANAVMWIVCGGAPVFDIQLMQTLPLKLYPAIVLPIGIAAGLFGSLFNVGLVGFQRGLRRAFPNERARLVAAFAVAAAVSLLWDPITGGGGGLVARSSVYGDALSVLLLLLAGKLAFTLFCYASGAPGGIFMPMLALGALVGAATQAALPAFGVGGDFLANCVLLGMAAFFVAVVRAPVTGAVLITEMAGSFGHFPAFMLVSIVAAAVAELLGTPPIYETLLEQTLAAQAPTPGSLPGAGRPHSPRRP